MTRRGPGAALLLGGLLGILAALDLARAAGGGSGVVAVQWVVALVALGAGAAWLRARGWARADALGALALGALLVPTYLDHGRELASDGWHYYAHLHSVLFDFDLDLANDYALLWPEYQSPDVLPVGAPLLWSPLVGLVHAGHEAARLFGAPGPTGVEPTYQAAVSLASLAYGAAGLFILYGVLRRWVGAPAAFWTTVLCWVGTPVRFYLSVLPCLAHACELFAAVLVVWASLALRETLLAEGIGAAPSRRRALVAGLACGLLFLVRSQDGLLLLLPGLALAAAAWPRPGDVRAWLSALGCLVGGFVAAALPQLVVWQIQFGVPFLVPHTALHADHFFHQPQLLGGLISPRGGLFATHPILLVAVAGLLAMILGASGPRGRAVSPRQRAGAGPSAWGGAGSRAARFDRLFAVSALLVLAAMWYLNASVFDWYQVRRFTGVVPLLAPGLALAIAPLIRASPVVLPALLALGTWRYDLAVDHLRPLPGEPVPVRAALVEMGDSAARDAYAALEPYAPRAAVAGLASYTGESLLDDEVTRIDFAAQPPVLRLPEPARHLSAPDVEDGLACVWIDDQDARVFLPLPRLAGDSPGLLLTLHVRALETLRPQAMSVEWNDTRLGTAATVPAWESYRFRVPRDAVRAGTNELVIAFDRTPIFRRMRGEGPREVRPAALAWLTLHRLESGS